MTIAEIIAWGMEHGWEKDKQGNLRKEANGKLFRLKFNTKKVRGEVRVDDRWVRQGSGFYKNMSIGKDGKLKGIARPI